MTDQDTSTDGWQLDHAGPAAYERYLVPRMFAPWAEHLLDSVGLQAGDRVLDVACGTGIVARRAAPVVGETGSVVGIDVNDAMLAEAAARSAAVEHDIGYRQGDATALPFDDDSFDVVCCQQALQFIPDPAAALREMHRVLAPAGRLAVSVWRPVEHNPVYVVMADALEDHVSEAAGQMMRSPFPDWTPADLHERFREADSPTVTVTIEVGSMRYPSVEAFLRREAASSPLADELASVDVRVRDALLEELETGLEPYVDDQGVVFPMETYLAKTTIDGAADSGHGRSR